MSEPVGLKSPTGGCWLLVIRKCNDAEFFTSESSNFKLNTSNCPKGAKNPTPGDGEWGWNDGWFSEAGLLAATEDRVLLSLYGGGG
jgi:hypothetical protein